jgi:hypothetical protein
MTDEFMVNNKPAVKMFARKMIVKDRAILFDCESDEVWLPKSCIKILDDETILIQEWLYNQNFEK